MAGTNGGGRARTLSVWQAVGLSVALMAPSMAANINPQGSAGAYAGGAYSAAGRAVPLTFAVAAVAVLLVSYGFVQLTRYFQHSGSSYAFVGATLGARSGGVAGWGLFGTYALYAAVTSTASGRFGTAFLTSTGIWADPPPWAPYLLAAVALVVCLYLAIVPARRGTSVLLVVEGVTVVLILLIVAVILVRLLSHDAPAGQRFTLSGFEPDPHSTSSAFFLGSVFGFLSFAGFEAAATLGEESLHPRRDIPRAILGTAIFGGLYFVVVTAVEVMGFGPSVKGMTAFYGSSSLIGDLGRTFLAGWVGDLVSLGAAISGLGCCLACIVGASRLLHSFARDLSAAPRGSGRGLGRLTRAGTPAVASAVVVALVVVWDAVTYHLPHAPGAQSYDGFAWSGTVGTLILLVVYILTTLGAIKLLFVDRVLATPAWQVVVPVLAVLVLLGVIEQNVVPWPASPGRWLILLAALWLAVGALVAVAIPSVPRRIGDGLLSAEGLTPPGRDADRPVGAATGRPGLAG